MHRTVAVPFAIALLALAAPALAEHHEKAGGQAAEHRSEKAAERSNAQWSEGSTKGERAERRELEAPEREAKKAKAGPKGGEKDLQRTESREERAAEGD